MEMNSKKEYSVSGEGLDFRGDPSVSIIVPIYNSKVVIKECLDSLLKINYSNFNITVVDDNSQDGSIEFIKANYPGIDIFKTRKNLGFAGTVNLGIRRTKGDIIALLNMDTVVDKMWLRPLVNALIADKKVGLVGSKILFEDNRTFQHAGGLFRENGVSVHIGKGEIDSGQYDYPRDVEYLCGASIAFRRDILKEIGFFDEGYSPLYYEDLDFAHRLKKKGFKVCYIPKSRLVHKENISTQGLSDKFYYHYHKNRLRFIFKNYNAKFIINKFFIEEKKWFSKELPVNLRPIILKTYVSSIFIILKTLIRFKLLKGFKKDR